MKAFITGARGFTGKHLVELLKEKKIATFAFKGDLKDKKAVAADLKRIKPDWIFHLASPIVRSDQLLDSSLLPNLEVDLFGTVYLIEAAAALSTKPKILITGSNAQYAASKNAIKETHKLMPLTGYGLSKLTQELVAHQLAKSYGLKLIMTRTFHLIGPGQRPGFVITDIARSIAGGADKIKLGNPTIKRDFTDVRDAAHAYYLLMKKGTSGESYNVCSGKTIQIDEIAEKLIMLSGKKINIAQSSSWRLNDPGTIAGDNTKLVSKTGWQPKIDLDQSLKEILSYWRKH